MSIVGTHDPESLDMFDEANGRAEFHIKGSAVTALILEITEFHNDSFREQLRERMAQAPDFFEQSAVVLQLQDTSRLNTIIEACKACQLQVMAVRCPRDQRDTVTATGLPWIGEKASRPVRKAKAEVQPEPEQEPQSEVQAEAEPQPQAAPSPAADSGQRPTRLIDRPVRSGQQIYAAGGDLIVTAAVSEGAEIIADGHIHVYGALRGRAIAGAQGDTSAQIFCQSLEAELLSIAGNFMVNDSIRQTRWKQAAKASLQGDSLKIAPL